MRRISPWLDRCGAAVSAACGIHCAGLGMLFVLWPGLWFQRARYAQELLWLQRLEVALATLAFLLAALALSLGWRRHRRPWPALLGVPGLAMIGLGVFSPLHDVPLWGNATVLAGGALMVAAHLGNLRMLRIARASPARREQRLMAAAADEG